MKFHPIQGTAQSSGFAREGAGREELKGVSFEDLNGLLEVHDVWGYSPV